MRRVLALATGLGILLTCLAAVYATAKRPMASVMARPIQLQDARVLSNTRRLLRQYNADVVSGRPATVPLLAVLQSLAEMIGQPSAPVQTARNSTLNQRTETEYEVLTHVNQEIIRLTQTLSH